MSGFGKGITKGAGAETESAGQSLGGRLSTGMKAAAAAGAAAIGAVLAKGIADNINIGKANDKLAAQLGLSAKESERVGKIAGGLYRDAYGDSIEGVNEAVGAVMSGIKGMADASSKDLQAVTATALDFATAFEVDVNRAVQIAGQAVSTGLAKDATEAFDLITAGAQKVPAALREDFLDATDEYGQFFATLGYSGEQAMAMLVDASEDGMYGLDKMGDAIKEFTIRSTDGSKASRQAFDIIGLSADEMSNKILAGGTSAQGATKEIIDGLLSIENPATQAQAAIMLFGTPLEDLNVSEIPAFLESMRGGSQSMEGFAGTAQEMGDTLNDNFGTRMEGWKRKAMGFVQDALMKLVEWGTKVVEWMKENRTLVVILAGVVGTLTAATMIYFGTVKVVTAATVAWNVIQKILNGTLRANPIGIVITALTLLAAGVVIAYKKSDTFREIVQKAWKGIQEAAKFAWERVIKPVFQAWKAFLDNVLIPVIKALWSGVVKPVFDAISFGIKVAWNVIKLIFDAWRAYLNVTLFPVLKFLWNGILKPVLSNAMQGVKDAWGVIKPIFAALGSFIRETVAPAFRKGVDMIGEAWDRIKAAAAKPVNFVIDTIYNNGIRAGFNKLADMLGSSASLPKMNTISTATAAPRTGRAAPGAGLAAAGGAGGLGDIVKTVGGKAWDWIQDKFMGPVNNLLGRVGGSPWASLMGGVGTKLASAALDRLRSIFGATEGDAAAGMLPGVKGKAGSVLPSGRYTIGMPYMGYPGHYGADYPAATGTPVFSPWPGRVVSTYDIPGSNPYNNTPYASYGRVVKIAHDNGMNTLYAHLNSRIGSTGPIAAGQALGTVGTNGNSTGPHLHFEARRGTTLVNPASLGLFDNGGWLKHGQAALNLSGRPEPVFSGGQWDTLKQAVSAGGDGAVLAELQALRAEVRRLPDRAEQNRRTR